ncbi:alpha/beta fold hydrolase [Spirillospora sp. NPDC049024]
MTVPLHVLSPGRPGAPLIVFAHGLEDAWTSWAPLARRLDRGWRMVALELPWRAGNDYRWRHRRPGEWLGDGLDLVGAVPDVLVAHSFGANAALELLCADDPRAGRASALLCPLYRPPRHRLTWRMLDRSRSTFTQHIRDGVRARLGPRAATLNPALLDTMMDLAVDRVGPAGFLTVFEQYAATADLPLASAARPALVIAGDQDPATSGEAARELAAGMPGAEAVIGPGYDHFCHLRHAPAIAGRIARLARAVHPSPTRTAGNPR